MIRTRTFTHVDDDDVDARVDVAMQRVGVELVPRPRRADAEKPVVNPLSAPKHGDQRQLAQDLVFANVMVAHEPPNPLVGRNNVQRVLPKVPSGGATMRRAVRASIVDFEFPREVDAGLELPQPVIQRRGSNSLQAALVAGGERSVRVAPAVAQSQWTRLVLEWVLVGAALGLHVVFPNVVRSAMYLMRCDEIETVVGTSSRLLHYDRTVDCGGAQFRGVFSGAIVAAVAVVTLTVGLLCLVLRRHWLIGEAEGAWWHWEATFGVARRVVVNLLPLLPWSSAARFGLVLGVLGVNLASAVLVQPYGEDVLQLVEVCGLAGSMATAELLLLTELRHSATEGSSVVLLVLNGAVLAAIAAMLIWPTVSLWYRGRAARRNFDAELRDTTERLERVAPRRRKLEESLEDAVREVLVARRLMRAAEDEVAVHRARTLHVKDRDARTLDAVHNVAMRRSRDLLQRLMTAARVLGRTVLRYDRKIALSEMRIRLAEEPNTAIVDSVFDIELCFAVAVIEESRCVREAADLIRSIAIERRGRKEKKEQTTANRAKRSHRLHAAAPSAAAAVANNADVASKEDEQAFWGSFGGVVDNDLTLLPPKSRFADDDKSLSHPHWSDDTSTRSQLSSQDLGDDDVNPQRDDEERCLNSAPVDYGPYQSVSDSRELQYSDDTSSVSMTDNGDGRADNEQPQRRDSDPTAQRPSLPDGTSPVAAPSSVTVKRSKPSTSPKADRDISAALEPHRADQQRSKRKPATTPERRGDRLDHVIAIQPQPHLLWSQFDDLHSPFAMLPPREENQRNDDAPIDVFVLEIPVVYEQVVLKSQVRHQPTGMLEPPAELPQHSAPVETDEPPHGPPLLVHSAPAETDPNAQPQNSAPTETEPHGPPAELPARGLPEPGASDPRHANSRVPLHIGAIVPRHAVDTMPDEGSTPGTEAAQSAQFSGTYAQHAIDNDKRHAPDRPFRVVPTSNLQWWTQYDDLDSPFAVFREDVEHRDMPPRAEPQEREPTSPFDALLLVRRHGSKRQVRYNEPSGRTEQPRVMASGTRSGAPHVAPLIPQPPQGPPQTSQRKRSHVNSAPAIEDETPAPSPSRPLLFAGTSPRQPPVVDAPLLRCTPPVIPRQPLPEGVAPWRQFDDLVSPLAVYQSTVGVAEPSSPGSPRKQDTEFPPRANSPFQRYAEAKRPRKP